MNPPSRSINAGDALDGGNDVCILVDYANHVFTVDRVLFCELVEVEEDVAEVGLDHVLERHYSEADAAAAAAEPSVRMSFIMQKLSGWRTAMSTD